MLVELTSGVQDVTPEELGLGTRIRCDPLVYFNLAKNICEQNKNNPEFRDLNWYLNSKKNTDREYRNLVSLQSFCTKPVKYHALFKNEWIRR
jgi:hypothetical protein